MARASLCRAAVGFVLLCAAPAAAAPAAADNSPYFASLKNEEVNMREGPSPANKVKWIYRRKGLPVEVLATFDVWRRVRDMDGVIGWIHVSQLSRDRTVAVASGADAEVKQRENATSDVVAEAKPGAIGRLVGCGKLACQVKFSGATGWIERARLWGVRAGDAF